MYHIIMGRLCIQKQIQFCVNQTSERLIGSWKKKTLDNCQVNYL